MTAGGYGSRLKAGTTWMGTPSRSRSQRQIVVLLRRHLHLLVFQHRQRPRDPLPRRMRHDDVVDIAPLRRDERRQEAVFVLLSPRRDLVGVADIAAEDDFHGA